MRYFFAVVWIATFAFRANAEESIGKLGVSDLLINPRLSYVEGRSGGFSVGDSLFGFRWTTDAPFLVQIKFGSSDLIAQPLRYTIASPPASSVTVIEGYAQYVMTLGRLRFGRVPLGFGLEGLKPESELILPRSFLSTRGLVGLRDDGMSYDVDFSQVFSNWTIHNGEGTGNLDNEAWLTVQAGMWLGENFKFSLSGQVGRTKKASTNPTSTVLTVDQTNRIGFDINLEARHRTSALSIEWGDKNGGLATTAAISEIETPTTRSKGSVGFIDGWYKFTPKYWAIGRFQMHDVQYDQPSDRIEEGLLGFSIRDFYGLSQINVYGIRRYQENQPSLEHEFRISLMMSPTLH